MEHVRENTEEGRLVNGNAKSGRRNAVDQKKKHSDDDCDLLEPNTTHIYLETEDGVPVTKALVTQQGQKRCTVFGRTSWQTLAWRQWFGAKQTVSWG